MKKLTAILVSSVTLLVGCGDSQVSTTTSDETNAAAGAMPEPANASADASSQPSTPKPWDPPAQQPAASIPRSKPVSSATKYPKGITVSGKKGYVKSPYAEHAPLVDVQGFPSGSQVYCPHTHKIFIVP